MARMHSILGYSGAGLTLAIAAAVPFFLIGALSNLVAHAGLHVDTAYTGGSVVRTLQRPGYEVQVYAPVHPRRAQGIEPFVQIGFRPAGALPRQLSDRVDLDGDNQPDVLVSFAVPADPRASLHGDVVALNRRYQSMRNVSGDSFARLLVRNGEVILLRVPLK